MKRRLNFCTLFDSYYLNRAIAMYQSLSDHCSHFHLYIFAFDDQADALLRTMNLSNVTVISLKEFEDDKLLAIKNSRSKGEYCWTCTPSVIHYSINAFNLDHCTYIDADLLFFEDPQVLVEELGDNSVLITEHRYSKRYMHLIKSGIYCVQFVTFRNTPEGMTVLKWWRERCIEWCYDRFENGKFGDQKYLDDWTTRFSGVHVLKHLGGGVAPWNVQQYKLKAEDSHVAVTDKDSGASAPLIFYHFHAVRFYANHADFGSFKFSEGARHLYHIYLRKIKKSNDQLEKFGFRRIIQPYPSKSGIPDPVHKIARKVLGVYHVYDLKKIYGENS
jgi:hypothetical protein